MERHRQPLSIRSGQELPSRSLTNALQAPAREVPRMAGRRHQRAQAGARILGEEQMGHHRAEDDGARHPRALASTTLRAQMAGSGGASGNAGRNGQHDTSAVSVLEPDRRADAIHLHAYPLTIWQRRALPALRSLDSDLLRQQRPLRLSAAIALCTMILSAFHAIYPLARFTSCIRATNRPFGTGFCPTFRLHCIYFCIGTGVGRSSTLGASQYGHLAALKGGLGGEMQILKAAISCGVALLAILRFL